ncbi:MAG: DEAD/DEAH box helicase, partial [Bacteroidota bacterium]
RALRKPPHILVATPGRLIDLVERHVLDLTQLTHLVLDEADEMLNMGFQPAINQILSFLPAEKTIWLFSATMPQEIKSLVNRYMGKDHAQVKVNPQNVVNKNIEHQYVVCPADAKQMVLQLLLKKDEHQRGIIFCRTKAGAQKLAQKLARQRLHVDAIHGDLSQSKRDKVMKRFKGQQLQALIATDVAARGIDVKDLHYVIHYNLPEQLAYYTHRSGRTARAGKQGTSLCIVTPQEVSKVKQISRALGLQFKQLELPNKEALDKRCLVEWTERLLATSPTARTTPALCQTVEEAFENLSKEALIEKLVAYLL